MTTVVIGIDASAKKPGWALLKRGKFVAAGVVRRREGQTDFQHMSTAARLVMKALRAVDELLWQDAVVAVEVQQGPIPAKRRKPLEWCIECRGRLLQVLGPRELVRIQASHESKDARRRRIELLYPDAGAEQGEALAEDAIDALAVAHAAWSQIVVRQHARS